MKTTILSLCMAFAFALNAQFIPQPMGYNPDSNSDGAIGSEDLMGLLSFYGTEFDNGDSLVTENLSFTAANYYDAFCTSSSGGGYSCEERACDNFPLEPLQLGNGDIFYINVPEFGGNDYPWYPDATGWGSFCVTFPEVIGFKSILVVLHYEPSAWGDRSIRFYSESAFQSIPFDSCGAFIDSDVEVMPYNQGYLVQRYLVFIHTHDGRWLKG